MRQDGETQPPSESAVAIGSTMGSEILSFPDRRRLVAALTEAIGKSLEGTLARKSRACIALPGGLAQETLYDALSNLALDWSRIVIVPSDERWVSTDDPSSNENVLRSNLLKRRAASATLISLKTAHQRPGLAVNTCERRIAKLLPFDLCLLHVGPDGHIASIIPGADGYGSAADPASSRSLAGVSAVGAAGSSERLTLTLAAILASRSIIILLNGTERRRLFERIRDGDGEGPLGPLLNSRKDMVRVYWSP
jgi:6-phosphogluconolactonase